jgi:hypothetical protein
MTPEPAESTEPPMPPPYVNRTIFLSKAGLRVHIETAPDDPWAYDVTHIPAERQLFDDEVRRDQAELWRIYEELKAVKPRGLRGTLADVLTRGLDRRLIRVERTERMRRIDAPPLDPPRLTPN